MAQLLENRSSPRQSALRLLSERPRTARYLHADASGSPLEGQSGDRSITHSYSTTHLDFERSNQVTSKSVISLNLRPLNTDYCAAKPFGPVSGNVSLGKFTVNRAPNIPLV